jgi:hypothetical protein
LVRRRLLLLLLLPLLPLWRSLDGVSLPTYLF